MVSSLLNISSRESIGPPPGQTHPYPEPTGTGRITFAVPGTDLKSQTYYLLYGTLTSSTIPLICLHGGPGFSHNYLLTLAHLSTGPYARPVIFYDQIGCGQSTHFQDKRGDGDFWTPQLFIAELENLVMHLGITTFDLLGQSWGGMLGAQYATMQPKRLRKLVIANSPADMVTWVAVANELRKMLDPDVQEILTRCEAEGRYDDEYEKAMEHFYMYFVCRVQPLPSEVVASLQNVKDDDTVYMTMNGPSEFHTIGTLKDWDLRPELHKIVIPVLLLNGKYDEAQDVTVQPYQDLIKGPVTRVQFTQSSHCSHLEETDAYMETVGKWLQEG